MLKSDELKQEIDAKRGEVERYQQAEELEKASKAADELKKMWDELKIALTMEKTDLESLRNEVGKKPVVATMDKARLWRRAFNKLVLNPLRNVPLPLTDAEHEAYYNVTGSPGAPGQIESVPARGGYLVSPEQIKTLQEYREAYVALKDYVTVVNATSTSGRWPIMPVHKLKFQEFAEMTDISESDVTFTEATYTISDHGLIIPISNQLIEDADVDIISIIGRDLAKGAVLTENEAILEPLSELMVGDATKGIEEATTIASHKALNTALYRTLDGVYEPTAKVFVNQDSFLWLANLEDSQNRPLFVPDVTEPNKYRYRGKEIVVIPNTVLDNTTSGSDKYAPIFVGDMRSYLTFFERKGLELSSSREYLWRKYAFALMGIIRFGVVVTDPNAMLALKVKL